MVLSKDLNQLTLLSPCIMPKTTNGKHHSFYVIRSSGLGLLHSDLPASSPGSSKIKVSPVRGSAAMTTHWFQSGGYNQQSKVCPFHMHTRCIAHAKKMLWSPNTGRYFGATHCCCCCCSCFEIHCIISSKNPPSSLSPIVAKQYR